MSREGKSMNGKKCSWSEVLGESSLVKCQLPLFLVNWILRSLAFTQDQMPGGAFFICEICTHVSTPYNLTAVSVVKRARALFMNLTFIEALE